MLESPLIVRWVVRSIPHGAYIELFPSTTEGTRCSPVIERASAHGAVGRRIDLSWSIHFSFKPVFHDWFMKKIFEHRTLFK